MLSIESFAGQARARAMREGDWSAGPREPVQDTQDARQDPRRDRFGEAGPEGDRGRLRLARCVVQALDWLEQGVALVDERDRVIFASAAARELLHGRRGVALVGDVLRVGSPAAAARLRHLVARCASRTGEGPGGGPGEGAAPLSCRIGEPALSVVVLPAAGAPGDEGGRTAAILIIVDPHRASLPSAQYLRDQFDLTSAQAALTLQVAAGKGLKAAARNLGIGISTARSHLRQVFGKTGTARQAELVRLVLQARHPVRPPS